VNRFTISQGPDFARLEIVNRLTISKNGKGTPFASRDERARHGWSGAPSTRSAPPALRRMTSGRSASSAAERSAAIVASRPFVRASACASSLECEQSDAESHLSIGVRPRPDFVSVVRSPGRASAVLFVL
jgi:hypothetical protein